MAGLREAAERNWAGDGFSCWITPLEETRRFTESLLPILAPRSSDVVVELWAPDPKCMKEVKQVASAQKTVTDVQAPTNQNEYVTLGNKAKEVGMTPWLLRPSS